MTVRYMWSSWYLISNSFSILLNLYFLLHILCFHNIKFLVVIEEPYAIPFDTFSPAPMSAWIIIFASLPSEPGWLIKPQLKHHPSKKTSWISRLGKDGLHWAAIHSVPSATTLSILYWNDLFFIDSPCPQLHICILLGEGPYLTPHCIPFPSA